MAKFRTFIDVNAKTGRNQSISLGIAGNIFQKMNRFCYVHLPRAFQ
ncbi:MAG: hypothetical protein WAK22_06925 [Candidatus Sulfotelmatobacter sp.]